MAWTIVDNELKKGAAFVVEGQLAYYKNPDTNREVYSSYRPCERFTEITPPKSTKNQSAQADEQIHHNFHRPRRGRLPRLPKRLRNRFQDGHTRPPPGQLVQAMINAEISRLSARKIAQRFLKSVMEQVGGARRPGP